MVGNVLSPLTFFLDSFHFPFCYELIVGSESTGFMEIVSDFLVLEHKHFLKPEQEIRNYFLALNLLEEKVKKKEPFSKAMVLEVQAVVEKGASKEKIGLRGAMPPGMLFAVYDSVSGRFMKLSLKKTSKPSDL